MVEARFVDLAPQSLTYRSSSSPKLLKLGSMPRKGDPERWRKNEYAKERGSDDVKTKK